MRSGHPRLPRWLARRAPLALLAALPVVIVGGTALGDERPAYTGTATFVVPSGATAAGPGSSYEARSLALTYARLIPEDRALLRVLARAIGTDTTSLVGAVRATPVVDTALVRVSYRSADLAETEKVIAAAVGALTGVASPTSAIPAGTLVLTGTSVTGSDPEGVGASRALVGLAALAVAAMVVLFAERTDPRVDVAADLVVPPDAAVLDLSRLAGSVARRVLWARAARAGIERVVLVGADERDADAVGWCEERLRPDTPRPADLRTTDLRTTDLRTTDLRTTDLGTDVGTPGRATGGGVRLLGVPRVPAPTDPALGQVTDHDIALVVRAGARRARVEEAVATLTGAEARVRWIVFAPARLRRHAETGVASTLSAARSERTDHPDDPDHSDLPHLPDRPDREPSVQDAVGARVGRGGRGHA